MSKIPHIKSLVILPEIIKEHLEHEPFIMVKDSTGQYLCCFGFQGGGVGSTPDAAINDLEAKLYENQSSQPPRK